MPHILVRTATMLRDELVPAKKKRTIRRALLDQAGINTADLSNIDLVDVAIFALTTHILASGRPCKGYGELATGLIIILNLSQNNE